MEWLIFCDIKATVSQDFGPRCFLYTNPPGPLIQAPWCHLHHGVRLRGVHVMEMLNMLYYMNF